MAQRALNVLFVCEKNSIRNVMAEALLNRFGDGRFRGFSAAVEPGAELNPLTVEILKSSGLPATTLKPRKLQEFLSPLAPKMDFIINLSKEVPSIVHGWPGKPFTARWGITDPTEAQDNSAAPKLAFRRAFRELENRVRLFVLVRHDVDTTRDLEESQSA